jgi:hypothetical protein
MREDRGMTDAYIIFPGSLREKEGGVPAGMRHCPLQK